MTAAVLLQMAFVQRQGATLPLGAAQRLGDLRRPRLASVDHEVQNPHRRREIGASMGKCGGAWSSTDMRTTSARDGTE